MRALAILVVGAAACAASPALANGVLSMRPSPGFHNGAGGHSNGGGGHNQDSFGNGLGAEVLTYPVPYAAPDAAPAAAEFAPPLLCPAPPPPRLSPVRDARPAGPHIIYIGAKPAGASNVKVIYGSD